MEQGVIVTDHVEAEKPVSANERLAICKQCPLFIADSMICNPGLWMNPETLATSHKAKAGYVKGCGCLISRKVKQGSSHCHAGRW